MGSLLNSRKEVIQCLIVISRGRKRPGASWPRITP